MVADLRAWLATGAALGLGLAAGCFSGTFAAGRACQSDDDCGPSLRCEGGVCGGTSTNGSTTTTDSDTGATGTDATGTETSSTTTGGGAGCDKLDIVIVLDNSRSMNQWNGPLLELAINFASTIEDTVAGLTSFHLGVVTTDLHDINPDHCQEYGALAVADKPSCDRFQGRRYLTEDDPLDIDTLSCFFQVDGGDDDEKPMSALLGLSSPELAAPGACNEGFLRDDALLVAIILTDEDDDHAANDLQGNAGSPGDPDFWYEKLLFHRDGHGDGLVVGALLGDEDQRTSQCPYALPDVSDEESQVGAEKPTRILAFMDRLPLGHAFSKSICDEAFVEFFTDFFRDVVKGACDDFDPGETTGGVDPTMGDPTDATTTGTDTTGTDTGTDTDTETDTDTDTGDPPKPPSIGEPCDPDEPTFGVQPFCLTNGYGQLGTVYQCDGMTWINATDKTCGTYCSLPADMGGPPIGTSEPVGCSGNGVDASEWSCLCGAVLPCSNDGCEENESPEEITICDGFSVYSGACADCITDPNDDTKPVCGPNPYPPWWP